MKNNSKKKKDFNSSQESISRKEAIKKTGRYAAVSATAMFVILNPMKAQAGSPPTPGDGF